MKEYLCSYSFCQDKEYIWMIDIITRGLFRIDKSTFCAQCMLSPKELYVENTFDVQKLLDWDDQIIMIPININEKWIIFHKNTKAVEQFCPIKIPSKCVDAFREGDKIICVPTRMHEPVAVVDMKTQKCINLIEQWVSLDKAMDSLGQIWNAVSENHRIYFPVRGFQIVVMTDGIQIKAVKLNLDSPIAAADFYKGRWWVLTAEGRSLYSFDVSGKFLEEFPLNKQFKCARLIITDRYVFILPEKGQAISVADLKLGEMKEINTEVKKLPDPIYAVSYWHYYYTDNNLIFLPHNYPCTVVKLDNLSVKHQEIFCTDEFVKEQYWKHYRDFRLSFSKTYFAENRNTSMHSFLKFVKEEIEFERNVNTDNRGVKIWKAMKK